MKKLFSYWCRALLVISSLPATGIAQDRTPVVLFPGWHATKLLATVQNQTVAPECPQNGTFETCLWCGPQPGFSGVCRDKLLTLTYNRLPFLPMSQRFSNQLGVTVTIKDYGKTESAPLYEPLFAFLESHGYTRNLNIRVAGIDDRLTPDMGGFLQRTIALIEQTYADNGNTPVHLVGHSNGPFYTLYLLTHTSQTWKNKYIHGFTPLAGNWPGQGFGYLILFTGFNLNFATLPTSAERARSSALMLLSHPSQPI